MRVPMDTLVQFFEHVVCVIEAHLEEKPSRALAGHLARTESQGGQALGTDAKRLQHSTHMLFHVDVKQGADTTASPLFRDLRSA